MKIIDNLLIIAAAFSLYTLSLVFSNYLFADVNNLIPDLFSGRAWINITSTAHQVVASIITGFLLVRYAPKPMFTAVVVAIAINFEAYWILHKSHTFDAAINYYIAHKSEVLTLLKPLIILPLTTYLIGMISTSDKPENKADSLVD